ncbi:MAG: hypothetical protein COA45_04285 [Zetaproteobacteria bacterium]|nr:MAG: hypothetical protein COA45_04285 [Zetaproteobacteria bacterium]
MTKNNKSLNIFFLALIIFSAILVLLPFIHYPVIVSELLISFRISMSVILLLFVLVFVIGRAYWFAMSQILLVVCNLWPVIGAYSFREKPATCTYDTQSKVLKVLSFNVYFKNEDYESIFQTLKASDADIIVLQEAQPNFMRYGHERLTLDYPFYYPAIEAGKHARWTLYSRYSIVDVNVQDIVNVKSAALHAQIDVNGRIVNMITLHAKSPKTLRRLEARNARLDGLGDVIRGIMKENKHVIVAGDFNNVPWHPTMKTFKAHTRLRNNDMVFNYFGTWPTWMPSFFSTPIDHIFYDEYFHHVSYSRKAHAGSDHYAISADLYFCE